MRHHDIKGHGIWLCKKNGSLPYMEKYINFPFGIPVIMDLFYKEIQFDKA